MRLLTFTSREVFRPYLPTKLVRPPLFADNTNIHQKSSHKWLKILVFEIQRCSKLHFTVPQPQLVPNFLTFDQF